jgi:hypothetical protein
MIRVSLKMKVAHYQRAGWEAQFQIGNLVGLQVQVSGACFCCIICSNSLLKNSIRLPQRLRPSRIREHLLQRWKRCATQPRVFQQSVKPLARQPGVPVEDRTPYA